MKLVIIVPYFTPYVRGNEYGLAEALTKLGHDVTIITSNAKAPRGVDEDTVRASDYTFDDVFGYNFKVDYLPTLLNIADTPIVTGLHLKGYDVVLLQEDYPFICHRAYKEAKKHEIKTILSSERTYFPTGLKGLALGYLDRTANKKLRDGVDVLTAHCLEARWFMRRLGVERNIETIHVGVDTELFKPINTEKKHLLLGDTFKILTVARLHKYKGLEYLIRAMKGVDEARLFILGQGNEKTNLKNLIIQLNLKNKVELLNTNIPNHKMPFLYSDCDVYVQPSVIEPFGIAVLEAMACGKPVIGTKVGGMLDTIDDWKTGFLVEPENAEELANRITILKGENKRAEMGLRARERAAKNFDWTVIGKKYQQIIEELMG